MNLFINIYKGWTVYEWLLIAGSVLLVFLLTNLVTYFFTKNWSFNKSISVTYVISAISYTLLTFIAQFLPAPITHLSLIPILIILIIITVNWMTLVSYYHKYKNSKNFSLVELINEQKRDSIRHIIFLTIAMLPVSIFIQNNLLIVFLTIYLVSSISIYLNAVLSQKFIND